MPKLKTHKGIKKRFKVSATGKVSHKRCGSSHLNSHKSGKQVRRLRKKSVLKISAEAHRLRRAIHKNIGPSPTPSPPPSWPRSPRRRRRPKPNPSPRRKRPPRRLDGPLRNSTARDGSGRRPAPWAHHGPAFLLELN